MWCSCMSCWCYKEQERSLKRWSAPAFFGIGPGANLSYPGSCVLQTSYSLTRWRAKRIKRSNERGQFSFLPSFCLKKFWRTHVSQTQISQLQEERREKQPRAARYRLLFTPLPLKTDFPRIPSYCWGTAWASILERRDVQLRSTMQCQGCSVCH